MINNLEELFKKLPSFLCNNLTIYNNINQLTEIVLDLGHRPEARFIEGSRYISKRLISWADLDYITKSLTKFNDKNRTGIGKTLHRVSCIRNKQFIITGITFRIGRFSFGLTTLIRDLLEYEASILFIGKPGVGKTTIIREMGRVLSNEIGKRVIIIDKSNEINGENNISHLSIGRSRPMQVAKTTSQHQIMIEAIENHMPQVIIIDEISTNLEVLAIQTIAEKGVQIISTTHGNCLQNLIRNPSTVDLIGGIQSVTLSDEEAKRKKTQKTILERRSKPVFNIVIEINKKNFWTVHEDVKTSIDFILNKKNTIIPQIRLFSFTENIKILSKTSYVTNKFYLDQKINLVKSWDFTNKQKYNQKLNLKPEIFIIYSYSISANLLKEVLLRMKIDFILTNEIKKADLIIGLKKHIIINFNLIKLANKYNIPIYSFNHVSYYKLVRLFSQYN